MAERAYSFKKAKRSGNREDWNKCRRLEVLVNKKVRSSEAEHYKGLINSASDPKKLWQSLSSIVGNKNHGSSVLHIEDGKQLLTEDKKIAFKFNKFFSSIDSKVAGKLRNVAMNAWENTKTITQDTTFGICAQSTIKQYLTCVEFQQSCWS